MAKIYIPNPGTFVAPNNQVNELLFSSGITPAMQNSGEQIVSIKITVGTWQFGIGQAPAVDAPVYEVDDEVNLPIDHGKIALFAKGSATNDAFIASVI